VTTIHIAATPLWQQVLAPVVGGGVGGGIAYLTAVRSLNKAANQAEAARQEERTEARKAALLALSWELEVNQELLERAEPMGPPALLPHLALDAALPWYRSLPGSARTTVHEAQLALVRYNADAQHLLSFLSDRAQPLGPRYVALGTLARDNVTSSSSHAVEVFAKARTELATVLDL
jgi:hypothetical protein